jgi:hypothetical protein
LQPGALDEPLFGTLHSVEIDKASDYHATSYCVGATNTPHDLQLLTQNKTSRLPITDSLFGMLKRLRSTTEVRRLWIDAICIDQTNGAEKGDQIMLMLAGIITILYTVSLIICVGRRSTLVRKRRGFIWASLTSLPRMLSRSWIEFASLSTKHHHNPVFDHETGRRRITYHWPQSR